MTPEEFKNLEPGDIVRHGGSATSCIVTGNYGDTVIAVTTHHMTSPPEWYLVRKARTIELPAGEYMCTFSNIRKVER